MKFLWNVIKRIKKNTNHVIIARNSVFAILSSVSGQIIAMITSVVMARALGVKGLGIYTFSMTLSAIIFIFLNMGLGGILQRNISQNIKTAGKLYANTLFLRFFIAIPTAFIICYCLSVLLGKSSYLSIIILGCLYTGLSGIFTIVCEGVTAIELFQVNFLFSIIQKVSILIITVISLYISHNIVVMLIWQNIVFVVLIFVILVYLNKRLCKIYLEFDWNFCKNYLKESIPQIFSAAAEYINLRSDLLILSVLLDDDAAGLYSVSSNIYIAASFVPLAIAKATTPTFNRVLGSGKDARNIVNSSFKVILITSMIVCIATIILSGIITVLWGPDFKGSILLLQILALSLIFMPMNRFFGYILVGLRYQNIVAKCTVFGTMINVLSNIALIPLIGITAVAITTVFTELFVTLSEYLFLKRKTEYLIK